MAHIVALILDALTVSPSYLRFKVYPSCFIKCLKVAIDTKIAKPYSIYGIEITITGYRVVIFVIVRQSYRNRVTEDVYVEGSPTIRIRKVLAVKLCNVITYIYLQRIPATPRVYELILYQYFNSVALGID